MSSIQAFFIEHRVSAGRNNRAQGLVGAVQGLYTQIQAISRVNVASATLANPQQLEQLLLSRNPMNVPDVTANYQTLYQTVPVPQNASPQTRDLIDMSDAAAQAAMKKAIAIDAIADTEMQAADQINSRTWRRPRRERPRWSRPRPLHGWCARMRILSPLLAT